MRLLFLSFILLFSNFTFSASNNFGADSLYGEFSKSAYMFDFVKAENLANDLTAKFPRSPLGFHANSMLYLWYFSGSHEEGTMKVFFKFSDISLSKFKAEIDKGETPLLDYRLGEAYMFRAMMYLFDLKKFKSFWEMKKASEYFEKCHELDNNFFDGYTGLGIFSYSLSYAPSSVRTALRLFGIKADALLGIKYLKSALKKGSFTRDEAAFQLSKIYSDYYYDPDSSNLYLLPLIKKYPKNIFFKYQLAINEIKGKKLEEALVVLTEITSYKKKKFRQLRAFAFFLNGEIYFMRNKFNEAIGNYDKFFEFARMDDFLGYASYKEGLAYLLLKDTVKAKESFFLAQNGNDENCKDKIAANESIELIETNFKNFNKNLIYGQNYIDIGKYGKALSVLENSKTVNEFNLKKKLTLTAEALLGIGKINEAERNLKKSVLMKSGNKFWNAKADYLFARFYFMGKEFSESRTYLKKAEDEGTECFDLKAKIRNLKKNIPLID